MSVFYIDNEYYVAPSLEVATAWVKRWYDELNGHSLHDDAHWSYCFKYKGIWYELDDRHPDYPGWVWIRELV